MSEKIGYGAKEVENKTIYRRPHLRVIDGGLSGSAIDESGNLSSEAAERERSNPAYRFFKDLNLVYIGRESDGSEVCIVDIDGIKNLSEKQASELAKKAGIYNDKGTPKEKLELLYEAFFDLKVVSINDFEQGMKPRKLLYSPETINEALDYNTIRDDESYLQPWTINVNNRGGKPWTFDSNLPFSGESIPFQEAKYAYILYNKRFGAAHQRNGEMYIRDKRKGSDVKVSVDRMAEYGLFIGSVGKKSHDSRNWIEDNLPNLVDAGLINPNNFKSIHAKETRRTEREVKRNGQVTIDRVRYYFGKDIDSVGSVVIKINDKEAIVGRNINDSIFPVEILSLVESPPPGEIKTLREDETQKSKFQLEKFFPKRADETNDSYQLRLRGLVEDFMPGIETVTQMYIAAELPIYDISIDEIASVTSALNAGNPDRKISNLNLLKDKFLSYSEEFGLNGIKVLAISEYDPELSLRFIEMSLGSERKDELTEMLSEFYAFNKNLEEFPLLTNKINLQKLEHGGIEAVRLQEVFREITESYKRRAKDLLEAYVVSGGQNANEVRIGLKSLRATIESVLGVFGEGKHAHGVSHISSQEREAGNAYEHSFNISNSDGGSIFKLNLYIRNRHSKEGQARINISLIPFLDEELKAAFNQEEVHGGKKSKRKDIRIGLDLDVDKNTGLVRGFSMDTGRSPYVSDDFSRSGDLLGKLLSTVDGKDSHNYDSFSAELSKPETFEMLAGLLNKYLASI